MRADAGWRRAIVVGFGFQALGLVIDGAWHATHPDGDMAPFWAHLPIHAGIAVLAVGVVVGWRALRDIPGAAWVAAGIGLQVFGDTWSLAVRAEANGFYVPAALIAVGGSMAFAAVVAPAVRRRLRAGRTRATMVT